MALQHRMLFLPKDAERISEHLAAARHDERLTFFDASGPIFSWGNRSSEWAGGSRQVNDFARNGAATGERR